MKEENRINDVLEEIRQQIENYPALLYMKGTPQFPQCGFSGKVVKILSEIDVPFAYINILEEPEIRANMVKVSEWPTFPQLFVNGELVGGCDILEELNEEGELSKIMAKVEWSEEE